MSRSDKAAIAGYATEIPDAWSFEAVPLFWLESKPLVPRKTWEVKESIQVEQRETRLNKGGKGGRKGGQSQAIALGSHYASDILRPYHSDDGSVLVKRGGAARDADLVSPKGLATRLMAANSELLNRPGKGVTMLSAQYAVEHPERNGLSQLHIVEEAAQGAKLLQEAQHSVHRTLKHPC